RLQTDNSSRQRSTESTLALKIGPSWQLFNCFFALFLRYLLNREAHGDSEDGCTLRRPDGDRIELGDFEPCGIAGRSLRAILPPRHQYACSVTISSGAAARAGRR